MNEMKSKIVPVGIRNPFRDAKRRRICIFHTVPIALLMCMNRAVDYAPTHPQPPITFDFTFHLRNQPSCSCENRGGLWSPLGAAELYMVGSCCWRCVALTSLMMRGHCPDCPVFPDQQVMGPERFLCVLIWKLERQGSDHASLTR